MRPRAPTGIHSRGWRRPRLSGRVCWRQLVARFRELMNLDQYLLWLASNALLQNGDSVDELWLLAEDNPTPQARARPYYTFFAWDPDDVFNPCHWDGRYAFRDPFELTYCAETEWDHILLGDPVGYALYVDVLKDLIETRLEPRIFDEILRETSDALLPFMARENVASAMGGALPERKRLTRVRPGDRGSYDTRRRAAIEPIF